VRSARVELSPARHHHRCHLIEARSLLSAAALRLTDDLKEGRAHDDKQEEGQNNGADSELLLLFGGELHASALVDVAIEALVLLLEGAAP